MSTRSGARRLVCATPFGTFERRTPRSYTHVVVIFGQRPEVIRSHAEARRRVSEERITRYRAIVESGQVPADYAGSCTLENYRNWLAAEEASHATLPAKLEEELAEAARRRAQKKGSDYRWSQSRELADAGAREAERYGLEVAGIFPVVGAAARAAAGAGR